MGRRSTSVCSAIVRITRYIIARKAVATGAIASVKANQPNIIIYIRVDNVAPRENNVGKR